LVDDLKTDYIPSDNTEEDPEGLDEEDVKFYLDKNIPMYREGPDKHTVMLVEENGLHDLATCKYFSLTLLRFLI